MPWAPGVRRPCFSLAFLQLYSCLQAKDSEGTSRTHSRIPKAPRFPIQMAPKLFPRSSLQKDLATDIYAARLRKDQVGLLRGHTDVPTALPTHTHPGPQNGTRESALPCLCFLGKELAGILEVIRANPTRVKQQYRANASCGSCKDQDRRTDSCTEGPEWDRGAN